MSLSLKYGRIVVIKKHCDQDMNRIYVQWRMQKKMKGQFLSEHHGLLVFFGSPSPKSDHALITDVVVL